jgi:glycosyltransferase involved in cell wall biosynthesis
MLAEIAFMILNKNRCEKTVDGHYIIIKGRKSYYPVNRIDYDEAAAVAQIYASENPSIVAQLPVSDFKLARMANGIVSSLMNIAMTCPTRMHSRRIFMLNAGHGCAMWRMSIPASAIDDDDTDIVMVSCERPFSIHERVRPGDVVFAHWVATYQGVSELAIAKTKGARIVYDMDDHYTSVAEDNPSRDAVGVEGVAAMHAAASMADCITTTTEYLKSFIQPAFPGIPVVVVPNSLNTKEDGWRLNTEDCGSTDGSVKIFWSGGVSHRRDLAVCLPALDRIMSECKNVSVVMAGYQSPDVEAMVKTHPYWRGRLFFIGSADTYEYFERLKNLSVDIGIAPIEDTDFNRCKSNIKFIEYSLAGMPTVASRVGPYADTIEHKVDGFLPKNTDDDWYNALKKLVDSKQKRIEMTALARAKVVARYDLSLYKDLWNDILSANSSYKRQD